MPCCHFPYLRPPVAENIDHDILHDTEKGVSGNHLKHSYSITICIRFQWEVALTCVRDEETPRARAHTTLLATHLPGSELLTIAAEIWVSFILRISFKRFCVVSVVTAVT